MVPIPDELTARPVVMIGASGQYYASAKDDLADAKLFGINVLGFRWVLSPSPTAFPFVCFAAFSLSPTLIRVEPEKHGAAIREKR